MNRPYLIGRRFSENAGEDSGAIARIEELLALVLKEISSKNLAKYAILHGSASIGDWSFVSSGNSIYTVSDIDLILPSRPPHFDERKLEESLALLPPRTLLKNWSPGAKISLLLCDRGFRRTVEARSLLASARACGIKVDQRLANAKRTERPTNARIEYPFSIPYAVLRWILWAGRGRASNAAAVYELAKGCNRHLAPEVISARNSPKVYEDNYLKEYLMRNFDKAARPIIGTGVDNIMSWLSGVGNNWIVVWQKKRVLDCLREHLDCIPAKSIIKNRVDCAEIQINCVSEKRHGLKSGEVCLCEYDLGWVARFHQEKKIFTGVLAGLEVKIEHVGSTSIPGMIAKPIIDVAVGVTSFGDIPRVVRALESCGLHYKGLRADSGGEILERVIDGEAVTYVHVVDIQGEQWSRYIRLRDYLTEFEFAKLRYENTKLELALRFHDSRKQYTAAKAGVINSLVEEAMAIDPRIKAV